MNIDQVSNIAKKYKATLTVGGLKHLSIIPPKSQNGWADGEKIQILVSFDEQAGVNFFHAGHILESFLKFPVQSVSRDYLRPENKDRILREAVDVF